LTNLLNGDILLSSKAMAGYMTTRHQQELVFASTSINVHLAKAADAAPKGGF